jgi:3-dehydroquinate synthase
MQNEPRTVDVSVPGAAYRVTIQPGMLSRVGAMLGELSRSRQAAVIVDSNVAGLHLPQLARSLEQAGIDSIVATVPSGEQHKTLTTLVPIYDRILSAKIDRQTPVLALGGGVVGDMAGFLAATILRGVPFVQIPTTLLSMVDASVGGKTGVDTAFGKNLIGAFHQPMAVFIDPEALRTLPRHELCNGLAECIKHEIIRDADGFRARERDIGRALELDIEYLNELIAHNVAIKAAVVAADPYEKGERAHLNFGHTFGHAIESVSNYRFSHGESVALGMCAAAKLSRDMGMLDDAALARINTLIARAGLPTSGLTLDAQAVVDAMHYDKKTRSGRLRLVVCEGIGRAVIREDAPADLVLRAVMSLR